MKQKNRLLLLLIAFLICVGHTSWAQSSAQTLNERIKKIESSLYQNPTACKTDFLALLEQNPSALDSSKGKIYATLATSFGMLNQLDSGLWAINHALEFYTGKEFKKASCLRTKAILYRLKGDYNLATTAIKECLQLNDSIWKNQTFKAVALQEYASLCIDQNNFYQATQLYLEALEIVNSPANKVEDAVYNALKIQINLAEAYGRIGNYGFAIRTFNEILPKLDSLKDNDGYIRSGYQLADAYIQTNQCASADSLVNTLLPRARQLKNEELESYLILKLGLSRSQQLKYQESLPYYRQAFGLMEKNHSGFILECVIPYLTDLRKTNGFEEAKQIMKSESVQSVLTTAKNEDLLNYKKNAIHFMWNGLSPSQLHEYYQDILRLSDTVKSEGQKNLALELQAKYQFDQQEKNEKNLLRENELLRQSERYKRNQFYLVILIASLLLITILLLTLRYRQRSQLQAKQVQVHQQEIELQKQQTEWALQEKAYRDQLLEQQKIVLTQTLEDSEKLQIKLNQMVEEQGLERRKELMEQFEKTKEEKLGLDKLMVQFNNIHPMFVSGLHNAYPKLSQSDLQFCILYRMNISTKDIASLLHIEPRSIYAKKYRIMEKMQLGKEDDFDKIIFDRG